MATVNIGFAAITLTAPSLLSDIVDYSRWKFGVNRAATYFSFYTTVSKANSAIGGAIGLGLASYYGLDATASTQGAETITGLRLAIAWLPASIILLSVVLISLIPINNRRHRIIVRKLDSSGKKFTQ